MPECDHKWIMLTTKRYEKGVFDLWTGNTMGPEGIRGCIKCFEIQGDNDAGSTGSWTPRESNYGYLQVDYRYGIQYNIKLRLFMRRPRHN